jgi:putative glutamine amidotransferase
VRPLIGLTTYGDSARYGSNDIYSALLPVAYVKAINASGGRAVLIPEDDPGTDVLDALDGIVFTGGGDLSPSYYGAVEDPQTVAVPARDAAEMPLLRGALDADLPILAICRGMQLLVAASGGTLHQHLPDVLGHEGHRSQTEERYTCHDVRFAPGSVVAALLGAEARVNSRHHQGVRTLGTLVATGWAPGDRLPDGTELIEAVEDPSRRFVLGVQWHPEDTDDRRLFAALVEAAALTRASSSATR